MTRFPLTLCMAATLALVLSTGGQAAFAQPAAPAAPAPAPTPNCDTRLEFAEAGRRNAEALGADAIARLNARVEALNKELVEAKAALAKASAPAPAKPEAATKEKGK